MWTEITGDNLLWGALLLNFIGQLLMLVTYHFTYEFQIHYQTAMLV
jgi:fluoride ion exporter CrcB/FEX